MIIMHWTEAIPDLVRYFACLSDDDLRKELMKFPDVESLRKALKGYMSASEMKVGNKERLIDKMFERKRRSMFISEIGKQKETNK